MEGGGEIAHRHEGEGVEARETEEQEREAGETAIRESKASG